MTRQNFCYITVYFKEDNLALLDEFDRLIRIDPLIKDRKEKKPKQLRGYAIVQLIKTYVAKANKRITDEADFNTRKAED